MENNIVWKSGFHDEGFTAVMFLDRTMNFINENGNLLSNHRFMNVSYFQYGFAIVQNKNKRFNLIDKNGKIIFEKDAVKIFVIEEDCLFKIVYKDSILYLDYLGNIYQKIKN